MSIGVQLFGSALTSSLEFNWGIEQCILCDILIDSHRPTMLVERMCGTCMIIFSTLPQSGDCSTTTAASKVIKSGAAEQAKEASAEGAHRRHNSSSLLGSHHAVKY